MESTTVFGQEDQTAYSVVEGVERVEGSQIDQSISDYRWNREEWEYLWNL